MTDAEQREAARQFVNKWKSGGDEKQDCHPYWLGLLQNVLGVENAIEYIQFEKPVKLPEGDGKVHTRYIDGYIQDVKVLIEQKGSKHPLDEKVDVLGASSDHLILDVTKSDKEYHIGDTVRFTLDYGAVLRLATSEYVTKEYI